mmetsp:Transcript_15877/g.24444  ORF Transcript_15877/g.24444 Transcript_15877/m.24444 type:complete len:151 (-) Transcript_15877:1858-2310(-)
MWAVWLHVAAKLARPLVRRCFFHKILLGHTEILVLELLYPAFQCPILVPELDELSVDFIHSRGLGRYVLEGTSPSELAILSIAPLHDALNLLRDKLIVVRAVVLKDAFYELQPLSKGLVLNLELEALSILIFEIPLDLLDIVPELGVGFQ